ncbi:WD domain repeat-containing protein 55 [Sparganum proliferum]
MTADNKSAPPPQDFSPRIGGDGINCIEFLPRTQNNVFAIGTSGGRVRFYEVWDDRQKGGICCTMKLDATEDSELVAINDVAVGSDAQGTLLAAVDNGCLVAFNIRRRRREMTSEPMGYSARAVITIKNNKKVLVGTDEGVVLTYNWNEFGSICDRFPVRTSRTRLNSSNLTKTLENGLPSVEKFSKINEDIVIIGTDDGALSAFNILPNRMISCLGWHTGSPEENFEQMGGDCMSLAVSPDAQFVASALPSSSNLRFWSLEGVESDAAREVDALKVPRKRRSSSALVSSKTSKSRATSREMDRKRCDFLSGLLPSDQESDESRDTEEDSDSDADSSEDSGDS